MLKNTKNALKKSQYNTMSVCAKWLQIFSDTASTFIEIVIMTDTAQPTSSSTTSKALLDLSFTKIDWQAPWMAHISQRHYLSQKVVSLSNCLEYSLCTEQSADGTTTEDITAKNINNKVDTRVGDTVRGADSNTVIAHLLNTAVYQKVDKTHHQPQTKPTPVNQTHTVRFVSQDDLPEGMAYEHFIGTTGQIPTRENLHDLFNGSIWLTFPKTKALLNYHHMLEMATQNTSTMNNSKNNPKNPRGRVRDTITVFDENGAILVTADPNIGTALINFNWRDSLVVPRNEWDNPKQFNENAKAAVYIFGHALLEQLIEPRKTLCAHSVVIHVSAEFFALSLPEKMSELDNKLAEHMHQLLSQDTVTPRQLSPLPILGVPHFWADNADADFYEDTRVFRSGRRQRQSISY